MTNHAGPASPQCAADMLFHLARTASHPGSDNRLTTAQWAALRFFDRASAPSRTPSGFARFHATTRGTASQTVKSLEQLGFLQRVRSPRDGRSVIFELTAAGRDGLAGDPLRILEGALEGLPQSDVRRLCDVLRASMAAVSNHRDEAMMGTCGGCRNLTAASQAGEYVPICGGTGERLATADFERLCVEFSAKAIGADSAEPDQAQAKP